MWRHLFVLPDHRKQGIGRAIVSWAYAQFPELAAEPAWLQSPAGARASFLKLGWADVEAVDLNLSQWVEGGEGSGTYRLQTMIREPTGESDMTGGEKLAGRTAVERGQGGEE